MTLKTLAFASLAWFGVLQYNQIVSPTDGYLGNVRHFTDSMVAEHNVKSLNQILAQHPQFSAAIPFPDAVIKSDINLNQAQESLKTLCEAINGNAQSINKLVSNGEVTTNLPNVSASEAKGIMADALVLAQKTMAVSMPQEMVKIQDMCKSTFSLLEQENKNLNDKNAKASESGFVPLQAFVGNSIPLHTQNINGKEVLQLSNEVVTKVSADPKNPISKAVLHMPPVNIAEEWKMIPFKPERWAVVTMILFVLTTIGGMFKKSNKVQKKQPSSFSTVKK